MVKWIGAVLVAAASLLAGAGSRQSLRQRVAVRRSLALALELLQGEMELRMPPVGELFQTVGRQVESPVGMILTRAGLEMELVPGRPPVTALRIASEGGPLDREEQALLLQLGTSLGRYDLTGQGRALAVFRDRAARLSSQAEEILRGRARASMTAAVCGGLALIIILL